MEELCYTALDLAAIINSIELGCRKQAEFLEQIWENEKPFLLSYYRSNKRQLILDTSYWLTYFSDKPSIDAEFPVIQKDAMALGTELYEEDYTDEFANLDIYFKSVRLRILYGGGNDYVKIKRRTLLREYGYKRMTKGLAKYFHQCTYFYHLQTYVRDYIKRKIEDIGIDEMIIFRVL